MANTTLYFRLHDIDNPMNLFWRWFYLELKPFSYKESEAQFISKTENGDDYLEQNAAEVVVDASSAMKFRLAYPNLLINQRPSTQKEINSFKWQRERERERKLLLNQQYSAYSELTKINEIIYLIKKKLL